MGVEGGFNWIVAILEPPFPSPNTDKFKWRINSLLWATTVKQFSNGGDKRAKGIRNSIGSTLFDGFDTLFSFKVERGITTLLISLDLDDEEGMHIRDPQKAVHEIISMVSKYSPTDEILRLVKLMRSVYSFTRKHEEII